MRCRKRHGLLLLGSLMAVMGCQSVPVPVTSPGDQALIGMAERDLVACAGSPQVRDVQGEDTILSYHRHAGVLERSFPGSKGSSADLPHGCEAIMTLKDGKVATVVYRPFPYGSGAYDHCDAIVRNCIP